MHIYEHLTRRETEVSTLSNKELESILEFQNRAKDFDTAMKKYHKGAMSKHLITSDQDLKKQSFEASTPELDHVQALAIKFRFFYANKEPTQFEKIANILRKHAKDSWAASYIDVVKNQYKEIMKSSDTSSEFDSPIPNREIINLWFNSHFFHSDLDKREKLELLHDDISKKVSLFQLYVSIIGVSTQIRSLYSIVHKLDSHNLIICTPEHDFSKHKALKT